MGVSEAVDNDDVVLQAELWPVPGKPGFYRASQSGHPINGVLVPASREQCDFLAYVRNGAHPDTVSELTGISQALVTTWRSVGSRHLEWLEGGQVGPQPSARGFSDSSAALCAYFVVELRKAEAAAEVAHVENWSNAGLNGDWRASRDFLARRWPERWREQREQIRTDGRALEGPAENSALPDLAAIIRALHEAGVTAKDLAIETTATDAPESP